MKRVLFVLSVALLAGLSAQAQKTNAAPVKEKKNVGTVLSNIWKKTRDGVAGTATDLADKLTRSHRGEHKVGGTYYMPLYDTNLYKEADGIEIRQLCMDSFVKTYPKAEVLSCVIPQQQWLSEPVKKGEQIVGYLQTLYCYIIARDGSDGFINSKYGFQRYKAVGLQPQVISDHWGELLRTDIIPRADYEELIK